MRKVNEKLIERTENKSTLLSLKNLVDVILSVNAYKICSE